MDDDELRRHVSRLVLTNSYLAADLARMGELAQMRDDEYPLKAVERLRSQRDRLVALLDRAEWHISGPSAGTEAWYCDYDAITAEIRGDK